ncbi:Vacuolar ABC heavy metal transporter (H.t1.c1) [Penicillium sp. IBT 18751x]|nr:Vacuolar ABC heavy metal transporter (H.t1.c1) [Penicillium sp. IBT 18751x]
MGLMTVLDAKTPPKASFMCWSAAIPIELGILSTLLSRYTSVHCEPVIRDLYGGPVREKITTWELIEVVSNSVRLLVLLASAVLYACKCIFFTTSHLAETTWLLSPELESASGKSHICGSATVDWWEYFKRYSPFWPLLWPSKSRRLQSVVAACAFLVVLQTGITTLSHYQLGVVTTALTIQEGAEDISIPWLDVSLYVLCYYLPDFLNTLRTAIWTPMSLYT